MSRAYKRSALVAARNAVIIERCRANTSSQAELAAEFGLSKSLISRISLDAGIRRPYGRRLYKSTSEAKEKWSRLVPLIVADRKEGAKWRDLSKKYGADQKILRRVALETHPELKRTARRDTSVQRDTSPYVRSDISAWAKDNDIKRIISKIPDRLRGEAKDEVIQRVFVLFNETADVDAAIKEAVTSYFRDYFDPKVMSIDEPIGSDTEATYKDFLVAPEPEPEGGREELLPLQENTARKGCRPKGRVWTEKRKTVLRLLWGKGVLVGHIRAALNMLVGPTIETDLSVQTAADRIGAKRPADFNGRLRKKGIVGRRKGTKNVGKYIRGPTIIWTPEMDAALIAGRREGADFRFLANRIGVCHESVSKRAAELGVHVILPRKQYAPLFRVAFYDPSSLRSTGKELLCPPSVKECQ